ncbi:MAG: hypothetical protein ACMG6S_23675, partial [Byssovorax sp.]
RWCAALLLLAPVLLAACGGAPQMKLRVSPANDTNDRLPCYLVVRRVDPKAYVSDSYQSVASMVMTPDDSVVTSALVFPGTTQDFTFSPPLKGQLAVYVLFTYPTGDWKTLLPTAMPSQLEIKLAASRLYPPAAR